MPVTRRNFRFTRLGLHAALLLAIWWSLTDGDTGPLIAGVPFAFLGAAIWSLLGGPPPVSLRGIAVFVPFFAWESLQSGLDVALRVFNPRLPIAPAFLVVPLRLPESASRTFMAGALNLLPGTLSVEIKADVLEVHVLDANGGVVRKLGALEKKVAGVFGLRLA
jgi:multicomponent Na+:H+ antiporter subunit E